MTYNSSVRLLALDNVNTSRRIYSNVFVNNRKVRFLLDCGSTVNIIPRAVVTATGCVSLRPPRSTLRMFDRTELPTIGMTTMHVRHPRTNTELDLDF